MQCNRASSKGFTIVELLIVIVVIAILAAIVTVAYNGVQQSARSSAAQSTVSQASAKIMAYTVDNSENYPTTLADIGLADTATVDYTYVVNNGSNPKTYCIDVAYSNLHYYMSNTQTTPKTGSCNQDTTIFASTYPYTATRYSDGGGNLKVASYFYSYDNSFTLKGGRVYLPSYPAGESLTIFYVSGFTYGGDVQMVNWGAVPSSIPNQYATIPSGSLHTGWNEVTFPQSAVIQPYAHGQDGHGVWIGYYFSGGHDYIYTTAGEAGADAIQSTSGAKIWLAESSFESNRRSGNNVDCGSQCWSSALYGIDLITQGP